MPIVLKSGSLNLLEPSGPVQDRKKVFRINISDVSKLKSFSCCILLQSDRTVIPAPFYGIVHSVEALLYNPVGRGFDSRCCHWNFFIDIILLAALWSWGLDSASYRNGYQVYLKGIKVAGALG